ncbi:MAG: phosphoglucosamine mutase [Bacteroidales bacterium]|nr:phosphoglucosamine mutase [Bacteroidales bacterium]MDZ4205396.1 phosphoglucosamine mutase [Bacteroidales bacterium]
MTLITSISGIRGTIGGFPSLGLTPIDIVKFTSAYAMLLRQQADNGEISVVMGRDARISGKMVEHLVVGTLMAAGVNVINLGLSTTPTVELAVIDFKANGGIILTASHNPRQWNALKMLNEHGEFISESAGNQLIAWVKSGNFEYAEADHLGKYQRIENYFQHHIEKILALPLVDVNSIKDAGFHVAIDAVNSTGGIFVPMLLKALGVEKITELYCDPNGRFPHNPEPLPEHLSEISELVIKKNADLAFVVDPDVDRLVIVDENGEMFGEEYTLVAVADYVLMYEKGNTVSNLSSTHALKEITQKAGGEYFASAVGEVNVVKMMKETKAIIGGEGNGGIIYPPLHYGRDALVGIALFLSHLAKSGKSCSSLRATYPNYFISKNKIQLSEGMNADDILLKIRIKYAKQRANTLDGLRIEFGNDWVHLRCSNTEPIFRIYAESDSLQKAEVLARKLIEDIREIIRP